MKKLPRVTVDLGFGPFKVLVHREFEDGNMIVHYVKIDGDFAPRFVRWGTIHNSRIIGL